ncbi:MAG: glycosyltransferase [Flavobacteriaceae bacterium]|nr:glycosyltransferase [Flavobacteriaceae bacterium]
MKICFLTGLYPFSKGGAEYQAKILSDNFSKYHEVFFITHILNNKSKIINTDNAKVYNISLNLLRDRISLYYFYFLQVKKILEIEKPDVIYHRVLMPYTLLIIKYANKKNIPFVFHFASEASITFGNTFFSKVRKYLFLKILNLDVHIIVQTMKQKEILLKYSNKKTAILPNLFYSNSLGPKKKLENNIVWIGKSSSIKQLNLFLDLAKRLQEYDINFIVIARFFEDDLSKKLLKRIDNLQNVMNLGEKHNNFINNYLSENAYLLVNTSKSEGFSSTFLQAWMCGVPVISLNSNPGNIFTENEMGLYCDNDISRLEKGLINFISDENYYNRVSKTCYSIAHENFSVEKVFGEYKQYLESKIQNINP